MTAPHAGELVPTAQFVLRRALHHGADQASVAVDETQSVDFEWRDGRLERTQRAQSTTVSIRLFVAGRYSVHRSSDLREASLEAMISQAVAMTRYLTEDPYRGLPDPERCLPPARLDLDLVDSSWASIEQGEKVRVAEALEASSRAAPGARGIATVTTGWYDGFTRRVLVDSHGFQGETEGTTFWQGSSVTVRGKGAKRPQGWYWVGSRRLSDLPPTETIGAEATKRALDKLDTRKVKTDRYAVLVENRAAGRLVGSLAAALSGESVQQNSSFLCGMLGRQVASPLLSFSEDPTIKRGLGSRPFDGEGMLPERFPVVERGVLRSYYLDTYYARKLGMAPTTGGSANLSFALGTRSFEDILRDLNRGILVTGYLGGNSNRTTGDFSYGVTGFYVEAGKRRFPVAEVNMAGSHVTFWKQLAELGNDPYQYSSRYCPTMLFEDVQITGL